VAVNDHPPLTWHIALTTAYALTFYTVITSLTRFSNNGSTLIGNIFTSCLEENYQSGVLINDISDHLPVFYDEL